MHDPAVFHGGNHDKNVQDSTSYLVLPYLQFGPFAYFGILWPESLKVSPN